MQVNNDELSALLEPDICPLANFSFDPGFEISLLSNASEAELNREDLLVSNARSCTEYHDYGILETSASSDTDFNAESGKRSELFPPLPSPSSSQLSFVSSTSNISSLKAQYYESPQRECQEKILFYFPNNNNQFPTEQISVDTGDSVWQVKERIFKKVKESYEKKEKKLRNEKDPIKKEKIQKKQLNTSLEEYQNSMKDMIFFRIRESVASKTLYRLGCKEGKNFTWCEDFDDATPFSQVLRKLKENAMSEGCILFLGLNCKDCDDGDSMNISHPNNGRCYSCSELNKPEQVLKGSKKQKLEKGNRFQTRKPMKKCMKKSCDTGHNAHGLHVKKA
eukprot:m.96806 g.96806  ORF g.96806 m.96806 type:complete len:336 (+) comp13563_c0_seq1:119-1126(+)